MGRVIAGEYGGWDGGIFTGSGVFLPDQQDQLAAVVSV